MNPVDIVAFLVFPYIALTMFVIGHASRYITDRYRWNAKSSEFLEKRTLFYGTTLFHWGILLTLFGHAGGLLIPQRIFDMFGIDSEAHTAIAIYTGAVFGILSVVGLVLLLRRRYTLRRIYLTTAVNEFIVLFALLFVSATGLYNVFFGHYHVLDTVAPWIRGIVVFSPDPSLMEDVPPSYKLHVLSALALLAYSPYSRLVHIWSVPLGYFVRPWLTSREKVLR